MLRRTFPGYTFLVSLAVASIYTNIPQEKGINTACRAYENFNTKHPHPHANTQRNSGANPSKEFIRFNETHGTSGTAKGKQR